ncbi:MAG: SPOR domain-containing protein [Fodinibius sp.]|nr:SPOR domain-containing protein [Fodinibius sp.]
MTIDKEQLITLLTDKTGLEREQVKDQLSELINRIRQAADEGKLFEIEGFGTFSMEEGELQFSPTDTLQTEINNKYAGMKPIELIGAFKEPEGEEIPDMEQQKKDDEDKVWAFDEAAAVDEELPVEEPVAENESRPEEADASRDDEQPEPAIADEQTTEASAVEIDEDDQQKGHVESVDSDGQAAEAGQPPEKSTEKKSTAAPVAAEESSEKQDDSDPIGRFLVAAVLVLAVGIGGWMVYESGLISDSTQRGASAVPSTQDTASQNMAPPQVADEQAGEGDGDAESASNESDEDVQKGSEPEQELQVLNQVDGNANSQQQPYGLHGSVNENIDGYTIVVHSLQEMEKANQRRKNLQEAGFRALVNRASVNGAMYYRVGLGQFESVEAAQQAVSKIPEKYRDNNFIKRIK